MKIRISKFYGSQLFYWEFLSGNNTVIARSERSFDRFDHVDRSARSMQKLLNFGHVDIIVHKNAEKDAKAFYERNRKRVWKKS